MHSRIAISLAALILFSAMGAAQTAVPSAPQEGAQQFAEMGTCQLANGQAIVGCRLGYRTYGTLNAERSNAVLVTTWFLGTSEGAGGYVGANRYIDPGKYFAIVVDAFADGVSSSPSNSAEQPRLKFPAITIRDMVEAQHRLVTEKLGITHLHAVLGGSMGGMQALQWAYAYPDFMDRIVAVVPTPRQTSHDLLLWRAEINAIEDDVEFRGGDYLGHPTLKALADIHRLHGSTPTRLAREVTPDQYLQYSEKLEQSFKYDPVDILRQLQAMMSQDVAPGKSLDEMGKMLKPKALIVVGTQDMMVNPGPATALAKASPNAQLIELDNDCGHGAAGCDSAKVTPAVREFLAK